MSNRSKPTIHPSSMPAPTPPTLNTLSGVMADLCAPPYGNGRGWSDEAALAALRLHRAITVKDAAGRAKPMQGKAVMFRTATFLYPFAPSTMLTEADVRDYLHSIDPTKAKGAPKGEAAVRAALQAQGVNVKVLDARAAALAAKRAALAAKAQESPAA